MNIARLLWITAGVVTIVAAVAGLVQPSMYEGLVEERIIPGVFTQDLVAAVGGMALIMLGLFSRTNGIRTRIAAAGLLGFLSYAYAIYSFEQVYTDWYFLYLAILSVSVYGLVQTVASTATETEAELEVPSSVRVICGVWSIFVAMMFAVVWSSQLIPLIRSGEQIRNTYSVYVIDLAFVMPALAVSGIALLRRRRIGMIGVPSLFILGAGILSPLAIAELVKPARYGLPTTASELLLYLPLSIVFLALTSVFLATLRRRSNATRTDALPKQSSFPIEPRKM